MMFCYGEYRFPGAVSGFQFVVLLVQTKRCQVCSERERTALRGLVGRVLQEEKEEVFGGG